MAALIAAIVAQEVVCEASCEWDPGVVLTLLISRFRLSAAVVGPVGLWAMPSSRCPQIHGLTRAEICGLRNLPWREVITYRIGEAGSARAQFS